MGRSIGLGDGVRRDIPAGGRSQASDSALVEAARAGDEGCFEALYERYAASLLSFCRHMLGSREDAEEAVQSAFIAAHREFAKGDRELAFRPWLYTVARNACLSTLRARREFASESLEIETAGLGIEVEQRAELRELLADLRTLPERQRAALLLTELQDLSQAEVADVLGCEVSKVKGLVFRARSALLERKSAREADCREIQAELSVANGGTFRKGRLKYHLEACDGCSSFLREVRSQRAQLAMVLPVAPTPMLYDGIFGSLGILGGAAATSSAISGGSGAAVGGAGAVAGSVGSGAAVGASGGASGAAAGGFGAAITDMVTGSVAKVAIVAVLGGGATGAANHVVQESGPPPPNSPPAAVSAPPSDVGGSPAQTAPASRATGAASDGAPEGRLGDRPGATRRGGDRVASPERSPRGGRAAGETSTAPNPGHGATNGRGTATGQVDAPPATVPAGPSSRDGAGPPSGEGGQRGNGPPAHAGPPADRGAVPSPNHRPSPPANPGPPPGHPSGAAGSAASPPVIKVKSAVGQTTEAVSGAPGKVPGAKREDRPGSQP